MIIFIVLVMMLIGMFICGMASVYMTVKNLIDIYNGIGWDFIVFSVVGVIMAIVGIIIMTIMCLALGFVIVGFIL